MPPSVSLTDSGYWHVRWHENRWVQWPRGTEPIRGHIFPAKSEWTFLPHETARILRAALEAVSQFEAARKEGGQT